MCDFHVLQYHTLRDAALWQRYTLLCVTSISPLFMLLPSALSLPRFGCPALFSAPPLAALSAFIDPRLSTPGRLPSALCSLNQGELNQAGRTAATNTFVARQLCVGNTSCCALVVCVCAVDTVGHLRHLRQGESRP